MKFPLGSLAISRFGVAYGGSGTFGAEHGKSIRNDELRADGRVDVVDNHVAFLYCLERRESGGGSWDLGRSLISAVAFYRLLFFPTS